MQELLIVANRPSENTQTLADAVARGAGHSDFAASVVVNAPPPLRATAADVLRAAAVVIGTTENFGYMSGQIKDFFERVYYPCLEKTQAKPWGLYVRAGKDGTNTNRAVHSIVGGMRWREVCPPLLMVGDYQPAFEKQCEEFGMFFAAGLDAGLF